MSKLVEILCAVLLPLAWGLAADYAFARLRRGRERRAARRPAEPAR